MSKILINSLTDEQLLSQFNEMGQKSFRLKQIREWLYKCVPFDEMRNIPKELIARLEEKYIVDNVQILKRLESEIDGTKKYLLKLYDDEVIEAVAMDYKHGMTICVSTQVGCAMGCRMCATSRMGLRRNLTPAEITAQVYTARIALGHRVKNVVFMGMGEPFDNFDNVVQAVRVMSDPRGLDIAHSHITISTAGLADGIRKLGALKWPRLHLAVSLNAPHDSLRSKLMPVNRAYARAAPVAGQRSGQA